MYYIAVVIVMTSPDCDNFYLTTVCQQVFNIFKRYKSCAHTSTILPRVQYQVWIDCLLDPPHIVQKRCAGNDRHVLFTFVAYAVFPT